MKHTKWLSWGVAIALLLSITSLAMTLSPNRNTLNDTKGFLKGGPAGGPPAGPDTTAPVWSSFYDTLTPTTFANGTCTITSPALHLIRFTITDNAPPGYSGVNNNLNSVTVNYVNTAYPQIGLHSGNMGDPSVVFKVPLPDNGYSNLAPLSATFKDVAGNQGSFYDQHFNLDGTPPCIFDAVTPTTANGTFRAKVRSTVSSSPITPNVNDISQNITFQINGPISAPVNRQINTTSNPALTCTTVSSLFAPQNAYKDCAVSNMNLPSGSYTYDLSAEDAFGNVNHTTGSFVMP